MNHTLLSEICAPSWRRGAQDREPSSALPAAGALAAGAGAPRGRSPARSSGSPSSPRSPPRKK